MRRSNTHVYVHFVWSTWDRLPLITPQIEKRLYGAIRTKCRELGCEPLAVGGTVDHVHLLVRLHPSVSISQLAKETKGASSHLITHEVTPGDFFKWQGGYGAFSVGQEAISQVVNYIARQKERHQEGQVNEFWEIVDTKEG